MEDEIATTIDGALGRQEGTGIAETVVETGTFATGEMTQETEHGDAAMILLTRNGGIGWMKAASRHQRRETT